MMRVMKHKRLYTILAALIVLAGVTYGVTKISVGQEAANTSVWSVRCEEDEEGNKTFCEMFSAATVKESGKLLAEIAIGYPQGTGENARGVITLPLGMLLEPGAKMRVDDNEEVYSFSMRQCVARGCMAIIDMKPEVLDQFKKGEQVTLAFSLGGKNLNLNIPLKGFTRALDSLHTSVE